jgi:hypothetical protein
MATALLSGPLFGKVLTTLGELARIPMPRDGKRDVRSMGRYMRDAEVAREHTMKLLNTLAGYQAEPEDLAAARSTLKEEATEAVTDASAWMADRKTENWE